MEYNLAQLDVLLDLVVEAVVREIEAEQGGVPLDPPVELRATQAGVSA